MSAEFTSPSGVNSSAFSTRGESPRYPSRSSKNVVHIPSRPGNPLYLTPANPRTESQQNLVEQAASAGRQSRRLDSAARSTESDDVASTGDAGSTANHHAPRPTGATRNLAAQNPER